MMTLFVFAALLLSPASDKTMAQDDWHKASITGVAAGEGGSLYLRIATGDLDGDGVADEGAIRLTCDGDTIRQADVRVLGPRDAASGMASGRRQHKPVTFIKEWGAATPQLSAIKPTYDVKKVEGSGARSHASPDSWSAITLGGSTGLCDTARKATKTRSNIQNN